MFTMYGNTACGCVYIPLNKQESLVLRDCRRVARALIAEDGHIIEGVSPRMSRRATKNCSSTLLGPSPVEEFSHDELVSTLDSNIRHAKSDPEVKEDPVLVAIASTILYVVTNGLFSMPKKEEVK